MHTQLIIAIRQKKMLFPFCFVLFKWTSVQSLSRVRLWPRESQHTRPPCPSPSPGIHSDSRPSSQWCHPAISSSVVPFPSCSQSLPASESFPMSQLFACGAQSTGVSASASFPPKKSQGWSPSKSVWSGSSKDPLLGYRLLTSPKRKLCWPSFRQAQILEQNKPSSPPQQKLKE